MQVLIKCRLEYNMLKKIAMLQLFIPLPIPLLIRILTRFPRTLAIDNMNPAPYGWPCMQATCEMYV